MSRILKVGTDCSGIESPIQALINTGVDFHHVFSSDIDKFVIKSIKANYTPDIIFGDKSGPFPEGDITKRDINDVPDIDLYVCGFPCQSFSQAGDRKGFNDERGNVFFSCVDVIRNKKPSYFILENVKGLLSHDKKRTFTRIMQELNSLEEYTVSWKVLNTRDYGIPQNRERVYIVGVKDSSTEFIFPDHKELLNILDYVDTEDNSTFELKRKGNYVDRLSDDAVFVDIGFLYHSSYPNADKFCPCIMARANMWCHNKKRYANTKEYLSLQGFPVDFIQAVSNTQMKKQAGNSMSVNVVEAILRQLLLSE
jgi:DNA (cytosine-5)-methyltransferase 1